MWSATIKTLSYLAVREEYTINIFSDNIRFDFAMDKFVVLGHHHQQQHPTRKLRLKLPKAKEYVLVAVKDGEKIIDTKRVIEYAVYRSSMSLEHQVRHNVPYVHKPCEKIEYLSRSL